MPVPTLTPEQRAAANAKAVAARRVRAELKLQLQQGQLSLAAAIRRGQADDSVGKMRVRSLLEALPGVGEKKATLAMTQLGIADNRRIRGLGPQQITALVERFTR